MFRDAAHVRRVVDGPIGNDLKAKFAAQNFAVQGFINYGARHLLTKEPVTKPSQLAGKRIRVIQSPLHTELWKAFGANPTPIPIPETYNALQTGVVDMMDLTKSAYAGFKLYEVVLYLTETGHIWATGVVYFSAPFWKSLKPEEKTLSLSAAAAEGALYFDQLIVEDEKSRRWRTAAAAGGKTVAIEDRASLGSRCARRVDCIGAEGRRARQDRGDCQDRARNRCGGGVCNSIELGEFGKRREKYSSAFSCLIEALASRTERSFLPRIARRRRA